MSAMLVALALPLDLEKRKEAIALIQDGIVPLELPCGQKVVYGSIDEIPAHDVPCPCGDGRHWMVKYV